METGLKHDPSLWCCMKLKYLLPVGLCLCTLLNIRTVYAQDPITFTDENGERVSYGEEREWTRTIVYVFSDAPERNYSLIQTTKGNEVWITGKNGITEYHIGNNGECGWPAMETPYVEGYTADMIQIPDIDLYWNPEQVNSNYIVVTYSPSGNIPRPEEAPEASADPKKNEQNASAETTDPKKEEIPETKPSLIPEETIEPDEKKVNNDRMNWVIPGAIACAAGIGAAAYWIIRKNMFEEGEEDE